MIKFRTAQLKDVRLLVELVNSAYRGESAKDGWTTEADILDGQRTDIQGIQEMITSGNSQIELALNSEDEILGCVYLQKNLDCFYLGMLTVNPKLQSKGIGKLLLEHSERVALAEGIKQIKMTVISIRSELISFYERRGYKRTGKTEPFPEDNPRFGLPKTKDLIFEEFIKIF